MEPSHTVFFRQVGQKFLKFAMWSAAGDGIGESFQLLKMVNIQKTMENS